MQKGSFRQKSFNFTGDGRSNGTAADPSVLPAAPGLALSILCNIATCLMELEPRWEIDTTMTSGGNTATVRNSTITYLTANITTGYDMYYTYLRYKHAANSYGPGLLLIYGAARDNNYYTTLRTILGVNNSSLFAGGVQGSNGTWGNSLGSGSAPYGIYAVYSPNGTWDANDNFKRFKLTSTGTATSRDYAYPLAYYCSSANYCYHITVSEETIGIFTTSSGWGSTIKGFVVGPVLDKTSLSPNDTSSNNIYASINTLCGGPNSSSYGELTENQDSFITYETLRYVSGTYSSAMPWIQFFKSDGTICSAIHSTSSSSKSNLSVLLYDNYYCMCQNALRVNNLLWTVAPVGLGILPQKDVSRMIDTAVDLITGSLYKGQFAKEFLIYNGARQDSQSSSNSYSPTPPTIGTLFDNGNYMYIGNGFWMAWHPDNGNIFSNTGDSLVICTPAA